MVKAPVAGRVKTRLGRDIGAIPATWWFRHQVTRLLREVDDPRWRTVLAVAPDTALHARFWPAHFPRVSQGRGDLGARMARLLRLPHPGPVCLVGGDIPSLSAAHISHAFAALGGNDFIFGPATDGGFWLAGLRHPSLAPAGLFSGVDWSTATALNDSLKTLAGRRVQLADRLSDVDRAADL
ncbi:DUF2064 domain-containing protein [Alisedimentitalea sp. MJ-SS2]|uniref:TIGR04282 family arsenosugar biosynthesis glycosyltransferase n=1 Tax=Aliisedimentitalea sp. MJ-SS2 TaxID=3049795 RepID=UPI002915A69D|nr:DUF2064 domain-containing protein [Alisedimentitalea sp. MJ-SS2]MDU8927552.1 DUF2064 domain-containing protein [Alisedimentitalea sp. MJ-SS2]